MAKWPTEKLLSMINGVSSLVCLSDQFTDSRSGLIRLRVAGVSSGLSCKHT